jgi:hypothetical protein
VAAQLAASQEGFSAMELVSVIPFINVIENFSILISR